MQKCNVIPTLSLVQIGLFRWDW